MRRVIRDTLQRLRWLLLFLLVLLTAGWVVALRLGVSPTLVRLAYAGSFYVDLFLFLQLRAGPESPRTLRLVQALPISRRDLGLSVWLLAAIGPAIVTTCAKAVAAAIIRTTAIPTPVDLSWLVCSGVFDLGYVGAMWWIPSLAIRGGIAFGRRRVKTGLYGAVWLIFCVYAGGPFALAGYMPAGWDQWRWHTWCVLGGLLTLTAISRIQAVRLAEYATNAPKPATPSNRERTVMPVPRMPFESRLSGLRVMLWQQFRSAVITSVSVMSLMVVLGSLPWRGNQSALEHIRQAISTLPADAGPMLWVICWMFYFAIGVLRWQPSKIPLLRTLPVSAREINLVLLMRTVVTCLGFWLALLPIYCLSPAATHPWEGLGSLVALIGATGLASAATLRWHRSPLNSFVIMGVDYLLLFGRPWEHVTLNLGPNTGQFICLALGICGIVAASMWNQRLLASSSALRHGTLRHSFFYRRNV